jgi:predicted DNA-binding transcriptional regulator YafY
MRQLTPERLNDIESQLRQSPEGLTSTELAVRLGVDASTVRRDLALLRTRQQGLRRRGRRYHLDFHQASRPLMLTPDEALPLYLACRLLARSQSERNPHAETVMLKLADTLHDDAPPFAHAIEDAARLLRALPERVGYRAILETVTQGWARGLKVALRYRNLADEVHDRRIHPYCIEPYGETNACYTIAFDERSGQIRTFRLDRALTATLTEEPFATPPSFQLARLFAEAWGVVWRDQPPQSVELRFFGAAAATVPESFWHPSQRITEEPGGTCRVSFRVSEPMEMERWIRQWGSEVEVLRPLSLRDRIAQEAARTAQRYTDRWQEHQEHQEHLDEDRDQGGEGERVSRAQGGARARHRSSNNVSRSSNSSNSSR